MSDDFLQMEQFPKENESPKSTNRPRVRNRYKRKNRIMSVLDHFATLAKEFITVESLSQKIFNDRQGWLNPAKRDIKGLDFLMEERKIPILLAIENRKGPKSSIWPWLNSLPIGHATKLSQWPAKFDSLMIESHRLMKEDSIKWLDNLYRDVKVHYNDLNPNAVARIGYKNIT